MDAEAIQVAIVDQHRVFVDALCFRLRSEPDLRVVCAVEDLESGWIGLQETRADVIVLDAEFPLGKSFDLAADIRRQLPGTKILFLVRNASDALLDQALRIHAEGIFSRSESLTQLVLGLRQIAAGERSYSALLADRIEIDAAMGTHRLRNNPSSQSLTDRQLEILRLLARGDSVKAVARKLFLSPKSVDNQKFRIMHKIGVRDKVSLALYAVREGLIQP